MCEIHLKLTKVMWMLQICATLGSVTNPPSMEPSIIYTRRFRIVLYAREMFLFLIIDQNI